MTYEIIQPPFTLKFREMSKQELKDYFQWFLGVIPRRIEALAEWVRATPGYEPWQPDNSVASLSPLGEWLFAQVESRPRTHAEIEEITSVAPFRIDVPTQELTNRTFSLAMDTGMYLSQVFLTNHPELRWSQEFGNKQFVDYGQPVLVEFRSSPFNPVRIAVTLAYGFVRKTKDGRRLREIYDYWAKEVVPRA